MFFQTWPSFYEPVNYGGKDESLYFGNKLLYFPHDQSAKQFITFYSN